MTDNLGIPTFLRMNKLATSLNLMEIRHAEFIDNALMKEIKKII